MRLTQKKKPHGYEIVGEIETERGTCITTQLLANHKLGQLEDIEEELGIDLITLFNALEDGFYARREGDLSKIDLYDSARLGIYHGRFVFYGVNSVTMRMIVVCVADKYRWALTKEELE